MTEPKLDGVGSRRAEQKKIAEECGMTKSDWPIDIAFVVSPTNARSMYMPMYYLYLAGYLEKHGFHVTIIDPHEKTLQANVNIILDEIAASKPRFIGLASFVTDFDVLWNLAGRLRNIFSGKIIVGNAHPSISPGDFLCEESPFDIVVRGEGELTLCELLTRSGDGNDIHGIRGLAYWRDGVRINPNREFMDLSECGMPAYDKVDMNWYARPTKYLIRRLVASVATIYTGRGCPHHCGFCAANSVWAANRTAEGRPLVRDRPIEDVMAELEPLQEKYGFDFFYIMDDTFGRNEASVYRFCDAYRSSKLRMLWAATTRANCIQTAAVAETMRDAGCLQLDFGVETGSAKLLENADKGVTIEQVRQAFNVCRKAGIRTFANMLLNLPGETEADIRLSERFMREIGPTYVNVGVTQPYPGTRFHDEYLQAPLSKHAYAALDRFAPTEETRMSLHSFDFKSVVSRWQRMFAISDGIEWSMFRVDGRYWKKLVLSQRRWSYLMHFIKLALLPTYNTFIRTSRIIRKLLKK